MSSPYLPTLPDSHQPFIPEDFAGDDRLMIETAEQFMRKEVLPHVEALDHQEPGLMPRLIHQAGELGLCGIDTPDEFGGLGLSKNLAARILEFLSLNGSFSVTYGITSGISQVGLSLFGSHDQKTQYLPRLASGQWIGAYALSEPNSGSDALSATCRADLRGDHYVLNGTKMWISNAQWADLFLVMAKVDGERFSAFLVEKNFQGVSVAREEHKMGLKGSSTARLLLEDAIVPAENLLYTEGLGHHVAFNALNLGRFKLAAMSIGPARAAIELAAAYAKDRKQFGQPIANFGLIREKFARMGALFFAAESAIYRLGALIDQAFAEHGGTIEGNRRAAEMYSIQCAMVKVFATEAESEIVDEALQVYGGYGFTEEFPIARIYRDARVSRIYEGTNEINRLFIADRLAKAGLTPKRASQTESGAVADLAILDFVGESARKRADRLGRHGGLVDAFDAWAEGKRLFATGKVGEAGPESTLKTVDWEGLGSSLIELGRPF
jgi:alkylation response protein AidB-like acyl-CoA dehydrogenase